MVHHWPTVLIALATLVIGIAQTQTFDNDDDGDNGGVHAQDIPYDTIHPPRSSVGGGDGSVTLETHAIQSSDRRFTAYIASQSVNFTLLQCRNYKDFYRLLYTMCMRSVLCSERYSLEQLPPGDDTVTAHAAAITRDNFRKFVYRLSLRQLFIIQDTKKDDDTNSSGNTTVVPPLFLLEDKVPLEWIPRYVVQLTHQDSTPACVDTFNTLATENVGFVHSTQYMLHLYSAYVRNDYECRHVNEWLVLDAHNRPHCECRRGKSCNNEGNYEVLIIVLTVILILLLIGDIASYFFNTPRILAALDKLNRTSSPSQVKPKQQ